MLFLSALCNIERMACDGAWEWFRTVLERSLMLIRQAHFNGSQLQDD